MIIALIIIITYVLYITNILFDYDDDPLDDNVQSKIFSLVPNTLIMIIVMWKMTLSH